MTTYFETKEQYIAFRTAWAKAAQDKVLTGAHHVLFNIVCNKPIERGFAPVTSTSKLQNGFRINHGLYFAADDLTRVIKGASSDSSWSKDRAEAFVKPFGDAFTIEMLATTKCPQIENLDSGFGKGKKLAKQIIENNMKNITFEDLYEIAA